jgi:hypothetical protein
MGRLDAWKKAAECEALAESSADAKLREKFLKLRDSWIRIANISGGSSATPAPQQFGPTLATARAGRSTAEVAADVRTLPENRRITIDGSTGTEAIFARTVVPFLGKGR